MSFRFHCTIVKRKMGGNGTVRLLSGLEAEQVWEASEGTVYQLGPAGQRLPVGLLQHTMSLSTEDIWTQIRYSGGCLTHHEYFDAAILPSTTCSGAGKEFTLRVIPGSGGRRELECEGVKYLVQNETTHGEGLVLTVCKPAAGGWETIARITGTGRREMQREFDIQMEYAASSLLCIALCSLTIFEWYDFRLLDG